MFPLRDAFFLPGPAEAVELRAFTHGLMPRTVPAMMQHFVEDWKRYGVDAWNEVPNHWRPTSGDRVGWWTLPEYLGDQFVAPLLNAPPGTCILQPNVHWTMQCLLSSREVFASRRTVLLTAAEFPSVLHSVRQWADVFGYAVQVLPLSAAGFVDQEAVLDAITGETALVLLSHVGFTTGEILPDRFLQNVSKKTHRHGGLFALDGYHATGSIPVDVTAYDVDLYMGGLLKEACGAAGNAYLYIKPGLTLTPRATGWFGEADPFAFQPAPLPHPDVRRRFLGGTSAVAAMYHAVEGVRVLLDAGLGNVRRYSLDLTERCLHRADAAHLRIRSPRSSEHRSALVILDVPAADRLSAYLKRRHIYTDSRQDRYLRMAPFVWNTGDEIDRTFTAIAEVLRSQAHLEITDAEQPGPVT